MTLFYPTPESGARKIRHQIVWQTRQKQTPVFWRRFLAPVSGACVMGIRRYNQKTLIEYVTVCLCDNILSLNIFTPKLKTHSFQQRRASSATHQDLLTYLHNAKLCQGSSWWSRQCSGKYCHGKSRRHTRWCHWLGDASRPTACCRDSVSVFEVSVLGLPLNYSACLK